MEMTEPAAICQLNIKNPIIAGGLKSGQNKNSLSAKLKIFLQKNKYTTAE